jgi:aldose 1-epimerase
MQSYLFGRMPDGTGIHAFTLRGSSGLTASVIQYGGRIVSLNVPTPTGERNVTLGLGTLDAYLGDGAHLGAITGRYANRIAGGRFTLDGRPYQLPLNNGHNTLHGGPRGFAVLVWQAEPDGEDLVLTLRSPDGDQGFPGTLAVTVRYRIDGDTLAIHYAARTDAPTVLNLTNHAYFNLAGGGTVMDHVLRIPADHFTPANADLIPTGELRPLDGTPLDFRVPTRIGARIDADDAQLKLAGGYDHCFVLSDSPSATPIAAASVAAGGMRMDVLTTEPGVQLYTGNFLSGAPFAWRSGFCLETQHFADSPNQPAFPSTTLRPGQEFASQTLFRFSTPDEPA